MAGILLDNASATDEERAALARANAARMRELSLQRYATLQASVGPEKLKKALAVPGKVISDETIEPGPWSRVVAAADHLRIIDLEGQQAVDFLCYDKADSENRYNAANTIKSNRGIYVEKGTRLFSDKGDILMRVEEDTVGRHDTIGGCCSTEFNYLRYGIKNTPSCRNNFLAALASHGMGSRDIPANINFFMNVPVSDDGSTEIVEGLSKPGDYVDLRAEREVLVVISNCPQRYNPCSGWDPSPVRLIVWRAN